MKRDKAKEYKLFYSELPQTDYLNDIEIQDEYEDQGSEDKTERAIKRGLTDEQVSQIAQDSLETAGHIYGSSDRQDYHNRDNN